MFRGARGGRDGVRCSRIQGERGEGCQGVQGEGEEEYSGVQGEGRVFRGTRERRVEWERYNLADQPLVHLIEADFQAFLGHGY